MISTASFFFAGHARMALTEGEGVSYAAVLLVSLALPLPVLHPGKREGYKGSPVLALAHYKVLNKN